jgi:UDP:flavonoid glycosyltransferase YjiC (YdhE family)
MRVLFTAAPSGGHLLPLMPMAAACQAAGHEVAVVTGGDQRDLLAPIEVRPAGPSIGEQIAETVRRVGHRWGGPGPEAAEFFAGTRVDLTFDEALTQAREFGPGLIVCESMDFVGPLVAAALGIDWVGYAISGGLPPHFAALLDERASAQFRDRGLTARPRRAYLDPYPDLLRDSGDSRAADRTPVRVLPFDRVGATYRSPAFERDAPRVLLTLGTSLEDPDLGPRLAESLAAAGLNVLVTSPEPAGGPPDPHVRHVGFVPLARVLPDVDLVVSPGGSGTLLSALAAGLPQVIHPVMADQPLNAVRATRIGAARTITDAGQAGAAAREVLADPGYRQVAERARTEIEALPGPAEVLERLLAGSTS